MLIFGSEMSFALDLVPVSFCRLLGFVISVFVIADIFEIVRQILLGDVVIRVIVGVFVVLLALMLR